MMEPIIQFEEKTSQLNEQFAEYLRGKSVVIVGRAAEALQYNEQGEFIDSHDVVVRMHDMRPYWIKGMDENTAEFVKYEDDPWVAMSRSVARVPEDWQSRLGKRCHIWYVRGILPAEPQHEPIPPEEKGGFTLEKLSTFFKWEVNQFKDIGGKFLCAENWINHQDPCEVVWQKDHDIRYLTVEHWINTMRAIRGHKPLGGTQIVLDILRHEVETVYLTGMPCIINSYTLDEENIKPRLFHIFKENLRLLMALADNHPSRVKVDDNMREMWEAAQGFDLEKAQAFLEKRRAMRRGKSG